MKKTVNNDPSSLTEKAIVIGHMVDNVEELGKLLSEQQEAILGISLALNRYQKFLNEELTTLQEQK